MKKARLTIKNYRGFSDQTAASIEIGEGLTALLGPNNAGKSSLKLFFFEMRQLFEVLLRPPSNQPNLVTAICGNTLGVSGYQGTSDVQEIFNNSNDRDLTVEIEAIGGTPMPHANATVHRIVLTCRRASPLEWRLQAFSLEPDAIPLSFPNGFNHNDINWFTNGSDGRRYDVSMIIEILRVFLGAKYYGAFRNALNQGSGQYYDFQIGTAFVDLWNNWKTSGNKAHSRAIGKITEEIRRLFEFEQLEINASVLLKTLLVTINGHQYRLGELGSGISQFIMALGNAAT